MAVEEAENRGLELYALHKSVSLGSEHRQFESDDAFQSEGEGQNEAIEVNPNPTLTLTLTLIGRTKRSR